MYRAQLDVRGHHEEVTQENPRYITPSDGPIVLVRALEDTKHASEKNFYALMQISPYHKPTQVVSSSRVKRTSERSSRNSANERP